MAEKVLSVFIDESGTFGDCEFHDDRYVVGLVFHEQDVDISDNIKNFKDHLKALGRENHFVHTGPLIRREHPRTFHDKHWRISSSFSEPQTARVFP